MKKETKKLIAAGIAMALSCGAWGSVSAADNAAGVGEDKNVNSIYSDGKISNASYGLQATGDASSSKEGRISLTTPKVEIHATEYKGKGIGIQGINWGTVIVGNTDTQDVSISGATQGVLLKKGGCAEIIGEQVKISNEKKGTLIEIDNIVPSAKRSAQLIVKGKQIELVSAGQVIGATAKYSKSQSYPKASVVLGDGSTESLTMTGGNGINAGRNSEIIGKAKNIKLVVNSAASTKGVQATTEESKVQLTATNNLLIDVTGADGAIAVDNGSTSGKVELAGNDIKIQAKGERSSVYGVKAEAQQSSVSISGNTVEIGTTGGKNGNKGEIGSAALYADKSSNIKVDANKVVVNTTNAKEHAFAVYSNWGSDIELGKDANAEVQISSSSEGTAIGVAVASAKGAKPPALEGLKGETSSTPTVVAPDGKVTIQGAKINVSAEGKKARGLYAQDNNKISAGNAGSDIQISVKGEDAIGVLALVHGTVDLNGKNAVINAEGSQASEGIHVQNNDMNDKDNRATVNVNTENTTINAKSALVAMSNSVLNVSSNLVTNGKNAILTRGNSDVNINVDGKHTTQLNGDIVFNYDGASSGTGIDSNVNVNLNGEGSFWTGNTKAEWNTSTDGKPSDDKMNVSHMTLQVENGAQWNPTSVKEVGDNSASAGSQAVALNSLKLNNGVVNLDSDKLDANSPVKVENISGNGTITTNSLDNKLVIDTKAAGTKLKVEGSGEIGDKILAGKATLQDLAGTAKKVDGKTASDEVGTQNGIIAGRMFAKVRADGTIDASTFKRAVQPHNQAVSSMANLSLMTWRQENNDMNKRLGEVRASEGSQGIWARMARGQSKYGAQGIKNQYNYYQLGYDSKISDDWILGGAFTYTDGDSSYTNGSGTNKHTGFAVYGSNLRDDGSFIDLIAKYAHMKNDFDVNGGVGSGDYSTNGLSFSAEYGKRFQQEGYWIEPQAELTYGRVSSADFTTKNGARVAKVHQDSMDSLVGRLGFSLGKDIKQGNVYIRASYLYDFKGETWAQMTSETVGSDRAPVYKTDLGGGWWEFGVGTNLNLGHDTHFYLDVETTAGGDVDTPWQWNAGVRYSF